MKNNHTLLIKTDGGARGNPGPAAIGVFIAGDSVKNIIHQFGQFIGHTTNNVAEYTAVLAALQWVQKNIDVLTREYTKVQVVSDSKLLVNQLNDIYKVKQPHLQKFYQRIKLLIFNLGLPVHFIHVKRELNKEPDFILNNVLESNIKG